MTRLPAALALVLVLALLASPAAAAVRAPHARLVLDQEFGGKTALSAVWTPGWFGTGITPAVNGNEQANYSSAHVSVRGGTLNLALTHTPSSADGDTRAWTGAIASTLGHFALDYGSLEVRAYLPGSGGRVWDWPAIVLNGAPGAGTEIDLAEGLAGVLAWHVHAAGGDTSGARFRGSSPGWHVFGVSWSPSALRFYYDGRYAGGVTQGIPGGPAYLYVNESLGDGGPAHPAVLRVAWVRAWAP